MYLKRIAPSRLQPAIAPGIVTANTSFATAGAESDELLSRADHRMSGLLGDIMLSPEEYATAKPSP